MQFPHSVRALNSRNYRLFYIGNGLALIGNWMALTASAWLIYELSNSAFLVGFLPFVGQIPVLLAPFGGILGDRVPRRKLLIVLTLFCSLQIGTLATFTLSGNITVVSLLALVAIRGFINAIEFPTRQSFIVEMVSNRADLPNAIALNSSLFNVARLIGPALGGALIAFSGPGFCYLVGAIMYLAVSISLTSMRTSHRARTTAPAHPLVELKAGLHYARHSPPILASLIMVGMIAMAGFAASNLSPIFARDIYHGDSRTLGFMMSAVGAGALASAIRLARRPNPSGLARWVAGGAFVIAAGQLGFAVSPNLPLAFACLVATGFGTVLSMAGNNTLIQSHVEDDKRGRVMGLFAMCQGMFPIGALAAGALAAQLGPRSAVVVGSAGTALAGLIFIRNRRSMHPATPPHHPAPLPQDSQT